jgi:hypothetical protein
LVLLQRQWLQGPKDPIFIHGFNLTVHRITILRRNGGVLCCRRRSARCGSPPPVAYTEAELMNRFE